MDELIKLRNENEKLKEQLHDSFQGHLLENDIKKKIEDDRMIELPCKIGDKLWCINDYRKVEMVICKGFIINNNSIVRICYHEKYADDDYNLPLNTLIFLTQEEAKQVLKENNND